MIYKEQLAAAQMRGVCGSTAICSVTSDAATCPWQKVVALPFTF
jgi:hypothetical protein